MGEFEDDGGRAAASAIGLEARVLWSGLSKHYVLLARLEMSGSMLDGEYEAR